MNWQDDRPRYGDGSGEPWGDGEAYPVIHDRSEYVIVWGLISLSIFAAGVLLIAGH